MSPVRVEEAGLPGVWLLTPRRFEDHRGFFSEVYNRRDWAEAGIHLEFVQENHSRSEDAGVVRGLHFQLPPHAQAKLVRVVRGAVLDVAVDVRRSSPTFGRHVSARLSADNWRQLLVPEGFAHGFATLEPGTEVVYKVTDFYAPDHERGVFWNDPDLGVPWPVDAEAAVVSEKDRSQPVLAEAAELFE